MHLVAVVFDQLACQGVLLVDDAAHLGIHLLHGLLAHVGGLGDRAAQEHFTFVFGIHHRAERVGHAIAGHHVPCDLRSAFKVVAGTRGHLLHEHFFSDAPTKQHTDLAEHVFAVVAVPVLRRQAHGHAQSATPRNHRHLVHRVAFRQQLAEQSMARLMVGRVAALTLGHDHALALRTHQNFVFGLLEVLHFHHTGTAPRCHQCRFVAKVGQVSP